jgi:hypothetical protein
MSAAVAAPEGHGRVQFGVAWRSDPVANASAATVSRGAPAPAHAHASHVDDGRPTRRRGRARHDLEGSSESGEGAEASWTTFDGEAFFDAQ